MPKHEKDSLLKRCVKCHEPILKADPENIKKCCLEGYIPDTNLCIGCNAVNSLISKMRQKKEITLEDCRILPKFMVFDPHDDNPEEAFYAHTFQGIADKYAKELQEESTMV